MTKIHLVTDAKIAKITELKMLLLMRQEYDLRRIFKTLPISNLQAICQQLSLSGRGTPDELILSILKWRKENGGK